MSVRTKQPAFARLNTQGVLEGFTIVELTVTLTVFGILIVSLMAIITGYFTSITRQNALLEMTIDSQSLLRTTVEEIRYGMGVRQTNTVADANAPEGGWNTSNEDFIIIVAIPAIDASGNYIIDEATGSPYPNELVYFKVGAELFKRTLANPDAAGNRPTTTCPEELASSACPADRVLTSDLASMDFVLYDQDNAVTTNPLLARSVAIDLGLERSSFGQPLTMENNIRVTMRNRF